MLPGNVKGGAESPTCSRKPERSGTHPKTNIGAYTAPLTPSVLSSLAESAVIRSGNALMEKAWAGAALSSVYEITDVLSERQLRVL